MSDGHDSQWLREKARNLRQKADAVHRATSELMSEASLLERVSHLESVQGGTSSLATMIRDRRTALGLSQRETGELVGVDGSLIYQIEVGRSDNPKILVLWGISQALHLPFDEVCRGAVNDATLKRTATSGQRS